MLQMTGRFFLDLKQTVLDRGSFAQEEKVFLLRGDEMR